MNDRPFLSVVIPFLDEEENVASVHQEISEALGGGPSYEVIFLDDGSRDGTWRVVKEIAARDPKVRGLRLGRNFGQSAALAVGFVRARGEVVVTMDGDGQNDPADIPRLLEKLAQDFDVVSGWRRGRKDPFLTRVLPSRVANRIVAWATGAPFHDFGCTLKAYRREVAAELPLYGEMHRFLPALALAAGARVAEIPVAHRPRRRGRSKYGLGRTFKVPLDLMTVKFLADYSMKPLYVFGGAGLALCAAGAAAAGFTLWEKIARGVWVHRNPLLLVAVFLFILGAQLFLMGLLAELVIRVGHRARGAPAAPVREETP